jgi:pimeloyl-ACP methyl ester carboxylesterase
MRAAVLTIARLVVVAGTCAAGHSASAQLPPPDRFTVVSDGHAMAVWARRPASPRGAVLLIHGRTWSSRPDFDLQVPGLQRSVLASLSSHGFAAYALDLRGYGETKRDLTGWLTPRRSAADILNVLTWIAQQHPVLPRPALIGWSLGGAASMLAAQSSPQRMSALVLFGFVADPDAPVDATPAPRKPPMAKNTAAAAASDFISPRVTPRVVVDAFVAQALKSDPITMDLKNDEEYNVLDPARVAVPTLVLYGERDINVPRADGERFLSRLKVSDKQMVELAGADHAAQLEDTHDAWVAAVVEFLGRPSVRARR